MKRLLLDECVDWRLLRDLHDYDAVKTVKQLGWEKVKNGSLLRLAASDFDVFITVDKDLPQQQNISGLSLAVIILRPQTTRLQDIRGLLGPLRSSIESALPGHFTVISWRDSG
jgi:predicted nuclease of predicted toxin-antitoxin system